MFREDFQAGGVYVSFGRMNGLWRVCSTGVGAQSDFNHRSMERLNVAAAMVFFTCSFQSSFLSVVMPSSLVDCTSWRRQPSLVSEGVYTWVVAVLECMTTVLLYLMVSIFTVVHASSLSRMSYSGL